MLGDRGFTLIELMITFVIIGVLSAIAVPQFVSYRTRAYNTAARADLKNLVTIHEAYFEEKHKYTDQVSDLEAQGFRGSDGVFTRITATGPHGFTAIAYHGHGDTTYSYLP